MGKQTGEMKEEEEEEEEERERVPSIPKQLNRQLSHRRGRSQSSPSKDAEPMQPPSPYQPSTNTPPPTHPSSPTHTPNLHNRRCALTSFPHHVLGQLPHLKEPGGERTAVFTSRGQPFLTAFSVSVKPGNRVNWTQ